MSTILMSACWPIEGMSPAQKAVLISLADQANDDGYCWPSIGTIARRTCLSERAVQGAIKWLQSANLMTASERNGTSSVYRITPAAYAPPQEMRPADAAPRGAGNAPQPPQMLHPTPADAAPKPSLNHQLNHQEPKKKRASASTFVLPDWINKTHWDAWHACAKRRNATDSQKQMAVDKLDAWRQQGIDHAAALENAAIAGWQGLFKPDVPTAAMTAGRRGDTGETAYQRSMRERMQEAVPSIARRAPAPHQDAADYFRTIEAQAREVHINAIDVTR